MIRVEILNMFNTGSWPVIIKSVVELTNCGIESADSTANSAANSPKIGLWVWAVCVYVCMCIGPFV